MMVKKVTYNTVINKFIKYNCELLIKSEDEFNKLEPNEKTIFEYKTACGHTRSLSYKSFMNGNGDFCLDCTKKRRGDKCREKTKIQYEDMCKEFESKGCKLLVSNKEEYDLMYQNNQSIIKYIASCSHPNEIVYSSFSNGLGIQCKECTKWISAEKSAEKQRNTFQKVSQVFLDNGCILLIDTEDEFKKIYKNNDTILNFIAKCGHEHKTSYNIFLSGVCHNCLNCSFKLMGNKISQKAQQKADYNYENDIIETRTIKHNLKSITKIFRDKECELIIKTKEEFDKIYNGIQTILSYIAKCGHQNEISVRSFIDGNGINCKECTMNIKIDKITEKLKLDFQTVKNRFEEKGCILLINSEEEFNQIYKNELTKLKYLPKCMHQHEINYNNFNSNENYGTYCLDCTNKNTGEKLKNNLSGDNKLNNIKLEFNCIIYLKSLLENNFDFVKAFDGCKSDIIIRPKNIKNDEWIGIQVKSTNNNENDIYNFNFRGIHYTDVLIICICFKDKKMWCFEYDNISHLKSSIGFSAKKNDYKYIGFEITKENINMKLSEFYNKLEKKTFDELNTPTNEKTLQEKIYKEHRESKLDFIKFKHNEMEGLVYDFMIGDKKIQEKVGSLNETETSNRFYLSKKQGKKKSQCYEKGDNDYYWLNCKNSNIFYVIPENILIEKDIVGRPDKKPMEIAIGKKNNLWVKDYEFDYEKPNKKKLQKLLSIEK